MKTFFDILFRKSKPIENEDFNGLCGDINDLDDGFSELGYYKYKDCCGTIHFQTKQFTKEQIEEIEKEAKIVLDGMVEQWTKEIDKEILKGILRK